MTQQGTTTLSQVLAIVLMVRRILVLNALIPFIVILSPLLLNSIVGIFDFLTLDHGFISLSLTLLLTLLFRQLIALYAPSKLHYHEAMRKSREILPVLSFCLALAALRLVLVPVAVAIGVEAHLKAAPSIRFYSSLRYGSIMFLLGLSVVFRYIWSQVSIVRCSPYPTVSRPLTTSFKAGMASIQNIDATIFHLATKTRNNAETDPKLGRRFQSPALGAVLSQLLTAGFFGFLSGSLFVFTGHLDDVPEFIVILSITSSAVVHALVACVDGSHELTPQRYQNAKPLSLVSISTYASYFWCFGCSLLIPLIAVVFLSEQSEPLSKDLLNVLINASLVSTLSSIYQTSIDMLIRWTIMMPESNLHQRCSELVTYSNLFEETVLDVALEIILLGDFGLLQSIRKPVKDVLSIQGEEIIRNSHDMELMAKAMLKKGGFDGGLSQDLQLCLLLESFGGETNENAGYLLGSASRHEKQIARWVNEKPQKAIYSSNRSEPLAVPLVRAFCAYAGGMGAALSTGIVKPKLSDGRMHLNSSAFVSWAFPPAAVACSEWAIVAAGRCVLHSIISSKHIDWRCSHLSMFVIVVLNSAFALRSGIQAYASQEMLKPVDQIPHLLKVINACDEVASAILTRIQESEGDRKLELEIKDSKCLEWYNHILREIPDTTASAEIVTPPSLQKRSLMS